mgnify:FL=1
MARLTKDAVARLETTRWQRAVWQDELAKCQKLRDALNSRIDWLIVHLIQLGDVAEATDDDATE